LRLVYPGDAPLRHLQNIGKKGEAVASPLFGAVKLLVNSWPAISERVLCLAK